MRILILGNGAREHALAVSLSEKLPQDTELYDAAPLRSGNDIDELDIHVAPGNPGMSSVATLHTQYQGGPITMDNPELITALAHDQDVDLIVIGPEVPLVSGVADTLRAAGFPVFGPSKAAAQIEGSKAFAKDIMARAGVATADAASLQPGASDADIDATLDHFGPIWVVKDDGLAAGKGVIVTEDRVVARTHVQDVLASGSPVLLESFLDGPEISLFCLVDGDTVVPLLPAQDHKRVGEGDTGPNTGGMGAYAPLEWLSESAVDQIVDTVVKPVAAQMVTDGVPFNGLLYAGLAWGKNGPAVVEFNCRFGDPETQAVLDLLDSPLVDALYATATGQLDDLPPLQWKPGAAVTVVLAAENYPGTPVTGQVIGGVDAEGQNPDVRFAGVGLNDDGQLVSSGGRVLSVIGRGDDLNQARTDAYEKLGKISLEGAHFRRDIGQAAAEGKISLD